MTFSKHFSSEGFTVARYILLVSRLRRFFLLEDLHDPDMPDSLQIAAPDSPDQVMASLYPGMAFVLGESWLKPGCQSLSFHRMIGRKGILRQI
jgi:hypothetical protein